MLRRPLITSEYKRARIAAVPVESALKHHALARPQVAARIPTMSSPANVGFRAQIPFLLLTSHQGAENEGGARLTSNGEACSIY